MAQSGSRRCAFWKARCASAWLKFHARRNPWSKYCWASFDVVVILKLRAPRPAIIGWSPDAAAAGAALAAAFAAGLTSVFICARSIGWNGVVAMVPVHSAPSSMASSGTKMVDCASENPSPPMIPAASIASTSGLRTMFTPPQEKNVSRVYASGVTARNRFEDSHVISEASRLKFAGEQTGISFGQQLRPPDRGGRPRRRQVQGGRHPLPAGAERIPPLRPCQVDLPQLRPAATVRRPLPSALRRHESDQGRAGIRRRDQGSRALARLRMAAARIFCLRLLPQALSVRRGADRARPRLRRFAIGRRAEQEPRHADRARPRFTFPRPLGGREPPSPCRDA